MREDGFYWVRQGKYDAKSNAYQADDEAEWEVARWDSFYRWTLLGEDLTRTDDELSEIGERITRDGK